MKRIVIIGLIILILGWGQQLPAAAWEISYEQDLFLNNNYFSISDVADSNYLAPKKDLDNNGWLIMNSYQQINIEDNHYFLGYIREAEGWGQTTEETINLILAMMAEGEEAAAYPLEVESWQQKLEGIRFGAEVLTRDRDQVSLQLTGKLLLGRELTQERYRGEVTKLGSQVYFSGVKDGIYSNSNQANTLQDINFSGLGYSFGGQWKQELDSGWLLEVEGENIYSWISWQNVYTRVMDYENYSPYDDQASISNGYYGYQDYITQLIPRYKIKLSKKWATLGIDYRSQFYPYINYQLLSEPVNLTTGLYREFINLKFRYKGLQATVKTKDLDLATSSGLSATLGYRVKF